MHPRMRALQVKDEDFTAKVQAPVTIDDIASMDLLRIRLFSSSKDSNFSFEKSQRYAEDECNIGFDRYSQFPYFMTMWVDEREEQARLMLFSDHYMSDGYSGMVVLNCVLEQVAFLAKHDSELEINQVQEFPLRPSLYDMWLSKKWLLKEHGERRGG
ncbi:unnamed protein product [Phytophthora lilii]|uniref:Unnamed protein product n=1 Tax=Phytophthora lilii TaxID=2077276 RepID=A0A9W6XM51_9STRA|nr:unnamed protein product [Phytophthora lilii]